MLRTIFTMVQGTRMSLVRSARTGLVVALCACALSACRSGNTDAEATEGSGAAAVSDETPAVAEGAAGEGQADQGEAAATPPAPAAAPAIQIEPAGVTPAEMLAQLPWSDNVGGVMVLDVHGVLQLVESLAEGTPFDADFLRAQMTGMSAMAGPMLIGTALPIDLAQATDLGVVYGNDDTLLVVAYAEAWQGQQTTGEGPSGAFALSEGWLRLGDAALVNATPTGADAVPAQVAGLAPDALASGWVGGEIAREFGVSTAAGAIEANGRAVVEVASDDVDGLLQQLAAVRAGVPAALEEAREDAYATHVPWLDYAELMHRAAWSRVNVERRDGGLMVELPAPSCGDIRQQYVGAILLGIGADLPEADEPGAWTDWDAPLAAGCNPLRGTPPSLPADAARIVTAQPPQGWGAALFVADLAWLARNALPDGMGSMPFSVEPDAIAAVFDGQPAGLSGWMDEGADTVWYISSSGDLRSDEEIQAAIVMPNGVMELIPAEDLEADEYTEVVRGDDGMMTMVSRPILGNLEQEAPDNALTRAMAVAELDAPFVFIVDGVTLSQLAAEMRMAVPGGLADLVAGSESVILTWTDQGVLLRFTVTGDRDAVLNAADAHLQVLLNQARAMMTQALGMPIGTTLLDEITLSASGEQQVDLVLLRSPETLVMVGSGLAAVALPAFLKYIKRAKTSEATMNIRKVFDGSVVHFAMQPNPATATFPPSVGPTPAIVPGTTPCNYAMDPNPALWEHPTWQALNFEVDDSHYYVYQYDSSGVGENAQFTASAFGDLDCDGVFSTFVRFGEVQNGEVSGSAGLYIQNELE